MSYCAVVWRPSLASVYFRVSFLSSSSSHHTCLFGKSLHNLYLYTRYSFSSCPIVSLSCPSLAVADIMFPFFFFFCHQYVEQLSPPIYVFSIYVHFSFWYSNRLIPFFFFPDINVFLCPIKSFHVLLFQTSMCFFCPHKSFPVLLFPDVNVFFCLIKSSRVLFFPAIHVSLSC